MRMGSTNRSASADRRPLAGRRTGPWASPLTLRRPGPGLDLRHLPVLRETARRGSFAAAADALGFTPSAVSQQMAKLERDVGTALFERLPRGTRLTEAGEILLAHAEALLARLADAEQDLRVWSDGHGGRLRLGCFPTGTAAFGADALERFRRRFPQVELHLVDGEPYESAARLKARELDLAVLFEFDRWPASVDYTGRAICAQPDLSCVDLFDDPLMLVMASDHHLASRQRVALADLDGERVIGSPPKCPPWGAEVEAACCARGVELEFEGCYQTIDFQSIQAIVATGRGVSLIPRLALDNMRDGLCARELEGAPVRHVRVARAVDALSSRPCLGMLEVLLATTDRLREGWGSAGGHPAVRRSAGERA